MNIGVRIALSKANANYPFAVQYQNAFGNWCSKSAHLDLNVAVHEAKALQAKSNLPVRVEHCTGGPILR